MLLLFIIGESVSAYVYLYRASEILTEVGKFLEEMLIYGGGIIKAC